MSSTGRGRERAPSDYYPTPAWVVRRARPWADRAQCAKEIGRRRRRRGERLPDCSCAWCSTEYRVRLLIVLPDRRTRDLDNIEKNILDA